MFRKIISVAAAPVLTARIITGFIFLSEGIQKFLYPETLGVGRFLKIGFSHPLFWAGFTGYTEIICAVLLLAGFLTRLAVIPLIIVMITAFISTKIPILTGKGFWAFAHEYRTDFALTLLLFFLMYFGSGRYSTDNLLYGKK